MLSYDRSLWMSPNLKTLCFGPLFYVFGDRLTFIRLLIGPQNVVESHDLVMLKASNWRNAESYAILNILYNDNSQEALIGP